MNMLSVQKAAHEFNMPSEKLILESIKLYIRQQLLKVEAELFHYCRKYGVKDVFEMDEKLKAGSLKESDIIDDFFTFDHLVYERGRLTDLLKEAGD